jgi:hypothetical protein
MIQVLMEVRAVVKTTLGKLFTGSTRCKFENADYHSEGNRQKMALRIPLTTTPSENPASMLCTSECCTATKRVPRWFVTVKETQQEATP